MLAKRKKVLVHPFPSPPLLVFLYRGEFSHMNHISHLHFIPAGHDSRMRLSPPPPPQLIMGIQVFVFTVVPMYWIQSLLAPVV